MTSRELWHEQVDRQVEPSIHAALQARVAESGPSQVVWERIAGRCADGRLRAIRNLVQWVASVWLAWMNWTFPMFETPVAGAHEQHLSGHNVHWAWLDYHRVNVRLAC